jgi:hypothetical protein
MSKVLSTNFTQGIFKIAGDTNKTEPSLYNTAILLLGGNNDSLSIPFTIN